MVLGLEKFKWHHRRMMFTILSALGGLYLFSPTSGMVSWIMQYQLDFAPFFSVQNLVGLGLIYLMIAVIYQQVT